VAIVLTDDTIQTAIIEARGDIFVASQLLEIPALRLDRAIAVSEKLLATVEEIRSRRRSLTNFQSVNEEEIRAAIDRRLSLYRVSALDALHDLATMPIDENSAQNQVKLAAAAKLAGTHEGGSTGGELGETLRELREAYSQNAPRLKVVRERMTVEVSGPDERVVSSQGSED
jgi:hypothetical protein